MNREGLSLRTKASLFVLVILLFFTGMLGAVNFYNIRSSMNRQIAESSRSTLALFTAWLQTGLDSLEDYLLYLSATDQDVMMLVHQGDFLNAHLYSYSVMEKCKMVLMTEKTADAFFLYSKPAGYFTKAFRSGASNDLCIQSGAFIKEVFEGTEKIDTARWMMVMVSGTPCLLRIMERGGVYIAALVDLQSISRFHPDQQQFEGSFTFRSPEGEILTQPAGIHLESQEPEFADKAIIPLGEAGGRYYIAEQAIATADLRVSYLAPYPAFWENFDSTVVFLLCFSCLVIGLIPFCFYFLRKFVFLPLDRLAAAIEKIRGGDLEARVRPDTNIREFQKVSTAFNDMMDEIKSLKLAAYEQRLESERAELQFLQIQIRPHFYLNCLKNLFSMLEAKRYENMRTLILTLSDYLRNMLQTTKEEIPLAVELHNVENYISLQQMIASQPPVCTVKMDQRLKDFPIPPLSILPLVENSVKHGSYPGRCLHIQIKILLLGEAHERFVNVTVLDDGKGFPDETLAQLNQPGYRDQAHIGISNVMRRFSLLYGGRYSFVFQNDSGSHIEFFIPYEEGNPEIFRG